MKKTILVLLVVWGVNIGNALTQSCNCEVSDRKETSYDNLLFLNDQEKEIAQALHTPWGLPNPADNFDQYIVLFQQDYIIGYDADVKIPLWTAHRLTRADLDFSSERLECFRRDIRITDDSDASFCTDYEEPVFDRGHMVPNADMYRSEAAMINTYILTNMVPQHDRFNRQLWKYLEQYVRDWAKLKGEIYVISGVVFDNDENGVKDSLNLIDFVDPTQRLAIPTHFYKMIFYERPNGYIESMTFLLPHTDDGIKKRNSLEYLLNHAVPIDSVEALTDLDFLSALHERKEKAIERYVTGEIWPTE